MKGAVPLVASRDTRCKRTLIELKSMPQLQISILLVIVENPYPIAANVLWCVCLNTVSADPMSLTLASVTVKMTGSRKPKSRVQSFP